MTNDKCGSVGMSSCSSVLQDPRAELTRMSRSSSLPEKPRSIALNELSSRFAEIRQLLPVAASVNPDRAIGAKGDYLSCRQCGYLLNLSGLVNSWWIRLRHTGSLRMTNGRRQMTKRRVQGSRVMGYFVQFPICHLLFVICHSNAGRLRSNSRCAG
jgi:hypothetical protein